MYDAQLPPPYPQPLPQRQRRPVAGVVLAVLSAVLVLLVAITVPVVIAVQREERTAALGPAAGSGEQAATLDEVEEYQSRRDHTDDDVDYPQTPPVGGPHADEWLQCGVYDKPVRDENAVHSLEHGTIWITYDADAVDGDGVAALAEVLPDEGIISPYPDLPVPVVVTVWDRQLQLEGADDPRLALFLDEYGDGHSSPEARASCEGGVSGDNEPTVPA
ncbi:DUF3105 domain-containing protein [Nocardioides speluncae]|uniref:DUF3105 domain-containing protein n=1 Tax=Nocardioides speluncae TaxID=2670337 RepID=UPI0012B16F21|nr:DUF3105 domain-containing protein [Nocardioides speluncae]